MYRTFVETSTDYGKSSSQFRFVVKFDQCSFRFHCKSKDMLFELLTRQLVQSRPVLLILWKQLKSGNDANFSEID